MKATTTMTNNNADTGWLALAGQVCVVTGAGSGIGAATAEELARLGALVAILDRDSDAAERIAHLICSSGGTAIAITTDVADEASVKAAAHAVKAQLGPCRALVNNAAVRHRQRLAEVGMEAWHRVLGVNLTGALLCSQAFASQMIEAGQGGSLIHVASLVGHHPQIDGGPYSVSKAAMLMMSRVLALELAEHRIRSNTVSPGFFRTPATEASYRDPEIAAARTRLIPAARIGMPQDMGNVISFLASDRSSYINAQDVTVDGGVGSTLMSNVPKATPKPSA